MSVCRSCDDPIEWVLLNDKPHPINPHPRKVIVKSAVSFDGKTRVKMVESFESHFATCKQADDWRQK